MADHIAHNNAVRETLSDVEMMQEVTDEALEVVGSPEACLLDPPVTIIGCHRTLAGPLCISMSMQGEITEQQAVRRI